MHPMKAKVKLFNLWTFRFSIIIPIVAGLITALITCNSCNDHPLFLPSIVDSWVYWTTTKQDGIVILWNLLKVPFSIALLSLPLAGLVAANHRSSQTIKQISITEMQIEESEKDAQFSKHFSHYTHFNDEVDRIEGRQNVEFYDRRSLYTGIFPNSTLYKCDITPSPTFLSNISGQAYAAYSKLIDNPKNTTEEDYGLFYRSLGGVSKQLKMSGTTKSHYQTINVSPANPFECVNDINAAIGLLASFSDSKNLKFYETDYWVSGKKINEASFYLDHPGCTID